MNSPNECIVLAGGFGTRLQSVVADVPKVLANINGKPFLHYLFTYLKKNKINRIILAVGYKAEMVMEFCESWQQQFEIIFSVEDTPLGTGGAIKKACGFLENEFAFVINGDTFFPIDLNLFSQKHFEKEPASDLSLALKQMQNFDRYGIVLTNEQQAITGFKEKQITVSGNINGGIYLLRKSIFTDYIFPDKFSFEKDFMESHYNLLHFYGFNFNDNFIDIGVPDDYLLAQKIII